MKLIITVFISALIFIFGARYVPAVENEKKLMATTEALAEKLQQGTEAQRDAAKSALLSTLASGKELALSERTKSIIEAEFIRQPNRETVLLAGLTGIDSVSEQIRQMAGAPLGEPEVGRFFGTKEWVANLIMARKGDPTSAEKLVRFAKSQDFHTQVVFVAVDMKYAPHPHVVEYLSGILDSNERLEPVKSTVKGMPAANYAASSLAMILKDFPVDYREDYSYTSEEINRCRKWMAAQKEWNFK